MGLFDAVLRLSCEGVVVAELETPIDSAASEYVDLRLSDEAPNGSRWIAVYADAPEVWMIEVQDGVAQEPWLVLPLPGVVWLGGVFVREQRVCVPWTLPRAEYAPDNPTTVACFDPRAERARSR